MRLRRTLAALLLAFVWAFAAQAGTTTFKGVSVDYGGASTNWVDGELVLTYKGSSQLKITDGAVKADVLVVGGGGAGGTGANSTTSTAKKGDGGNGGEVVQRGCLLTQGSKLTIAVGAGGQVNTTAASQGKSGGKTTVSSTDVAFEAIEAAGGTGGTAKSSTSSAGTPASGTVVDGTEYGKGGAKAPSSGESAAGDPNTGAGGQGGRAYTNSKYRNGGAGGSGVVVVRLREAIELLKDLDLRVGETVSEFRDAPDQPVGFAYSDVTCSSSVDLVASVVETADGKVGVVGHMAGQTQITIVAGGKTYLLVVTVNPLITGKIRVGAYEVDVKNASRTNWVDGELVITYLDTTADKSFTLPQETKGRLLAVGGGGAGGQEPGARDDSYGLPGGGGAGGMVVNDSQDFAAATYAVVVGAGGVAPRTKPKNATAGASGTASTVIGGGETLANALGGGGGGARSAGNAGGSGGGGSASYASSKVQAKNGGSGTSEQGYAGGKGGNAKYGAGGGGAGGPGNPTMNDIVDGSGAGGTGKKCDITGEDLEYARGGAGGVPRLWTHYWYDEKGDKHYASITTDSKTGKITSITYAVTGDELGKNKYFWCEASDGKPGRDGYGDGGGGGSYYDTSRGPTFAGSGGNGVVIVRIPPYKTTVEDALKTAFAGQSVTVSGGMVTLAKDVTGPIAIPDNLGAVTIKLNGHAIIGADGADGDDITPGGDGQPALKIVPHEYDCESGVTILSVTGTGSLKGGNGGKGYPGGAGAVAVAAEGFTVAVADGIAVTAGEAGESLVQHPHKWAYTIKDNKIVAYCVAEDGEPCSYRDLSRGPFVAVSAADAAYTAMRYDELTAVNGITPVTGIVVAPETYVGREGTVYPETSTPPREQGAYTVNMQLGDLRITSDFTITEPKPSQGSVYQAWKTAERKGRDVQICLSATFDGSKAINDGNVLFLGSRCSAHSMKGGTVESSVNAMTRYASVRWYAYGSSDPENNLVDKLTKKGQTVSETVPLTGGNHFVHTEMMDDLYAELVEKRNRADGYDLIILEFDGDLLCREGAEPYQLVYSLPEGWTDEKVARLRAAMSRYYAEDRVVWIVPDVNQEKSDAGYTGEYPWTSNPEFIWQRAFLNATEKEGYKCPLQKNYEDADELVAYLQEVLVGHFFSNAIIKDTLASGLTITKVTPQMRGTNGIWRNFEGGPSRYTIPEPRSGTTVTADVERVERQVTVTFDMKAEQAWACEHNQVIGDDFRVVIDAALDGFFSDVDEGGEKATNDGDATFTFTDPNLEEDADDYEIEINVDSPTIQNVKPTPDYTAEDVVKIYDGKGTNIVVKPIAPTPDEAVIRYSLDEHGTYVDNFALTNVCDKTKVWFTITDNVGEFTTVTNYACVTILPLPPGPPQEESMGIVASPAEKFYDAEGTNITWAVTNALGAAITDATISLREKGTDPWIPAADFVLYVDTTNVTVEVKAEKAGFTPVTAEATVLVKPRPVTLVAASDSKVFDGTPLTNWTFTVKADTTTPGYGFVKDEGVDSVTMTAESTITDPGSVDNVIASETAKPDTKLDRNYVVSTEKGTLTVTPATFTASAEPVEKFYDSTPTNIIVTVAGIPSGVTPTYEYSYSETEGYVPASDFTGPTNVSETAEIWCRVIIPGTTNTVRATATIKPRIVVNHAKDGEWTYNGEEHAQPDYFEDADAEAERSKAKWGTDELLPDSTGFVEGEGYASDLAMTEASKITDPGSVPNVIDQAADKTAFKPNTKAENYELYYLDGTLKVTDATMGIQALSVEKFYDAEPTNITWVVTNATAAAITPDKVYLREQGGEWVEAKDFVLYVDTTNATVQVRAEKVGFTAVEAEATVLIKPRPVTLVAGSASKTYDGTPLTCDTFTVKEGTAPEYGFVGDEGVASVTMTLESTITEPGLKPNVIASETAKDGTKLGRNYVVSTEPGTLTVTAAAMGIEAFDAEKFYDAEPTNVAWVVTNAAGVAITPDKVYLREKNTTDWIPAADFVQYVDTTNMTVEVKAEKSGFDNCFAEATVLVKPRPVTLVAGSASKTYDGTPLTCDSFTVKEDTAPEYGFVKEEGIASVTMTDDSTITLPGSQPNVIATTVAKPNTKLERNYVVSTEPGALKVTAAAFAASAEPVEKFYDAVPTNIVVEVSGVPAGMTPTYEYSYHETAGFVPAADFTGPTNVSETATVYCRVIIPGTTNVVSATATIKPRIVVSHAKDGEWTFNGAEHKQPDYFEDTDAEAERSKEKWGTDEALPGSTGFVDGEGYAADLVMTDASRITNPGTKPNVIDTAADKTALKPNTKAGNYELYYLDGTLTVTPAAFTASAEPVEKFYDSTPTNIIVTVSGIPSGVTPTYEYSYSETEGFVPAADFTGPTNVSESAEIWCRVIIPGTTNVVSAVATIKPRIVVSHAKDGEWTFNGEEHKQPDSYEDTAEESKLSKEKWGTDEVLPDSTGFVNGEGYADDLVMTDASKITLPGTKPNVIDQTADKVVLKDNTKPENYELHYLDGTLKVTPAAFTASAEPVEKFYDSTPTNIIVTVSGIPSGVTPIYEYSYSETEGYVPAADFTGPTNVLETAEIWCRVIIPGTTNVVSATATIKPRIVVSHAKDGEWTFNGAEHAQPDSFEDEDAEAEKSKEKWGTDEVLPDSTGFVDGEGYAADLVMTDASRITLPGTKPNVIDQAADKTALKPNTKAGNYEFHYLNGTLTVTAAAMGIEAFDAEKFYDAEPTNITWAVTNAQGVAITDAAIFLREKNTEPWIPVVDFTLYVDTTNATVEVKAEKTGFAPVTAEATVLVKPRPVTLVAASDSKVYDGLPLTTNGFTVKADTTTPGYGFVKDEGVASVTMTPESTITNPGSVDNVIASEVALPGTKLERNYILSTEPGALTVTSATFTASATPYDEFYDGQEHTIEVDIQKPEEAGEVTITYAYAEGGAYLPIEDFEQLKDVTSGGPVTVYAKIEVEGYSTVVVNATVNIKPRIVVEQAESASKIFDGLPLVQPNHHEEPDVEAEKSKAKWGTPEAPANSTGFVEGEGFAGVPMTAGSTITEPGVTDNVIDVAAVTLQEGTRPGNYIFFYLPGELAIIQRQEEVRRDPEVEIPEEAKKVVEESDKKIEEVLNELVKSDPKAGEEPYIKYQLTVTPTNRLDETTRTTPEKAAEDAKEQIERFKETMPDAKVDKVEFVDIVLERTYSKEEAEETAKGNYNKDNWESLDKAEEHGNRLLEVTIPVEVPDGMELVGVTRSCDNKGTEVLKPKDPNDPNAEGFVYDPETKTVTLYAYDFCVFGFVMTDTKEDPPAPPLPPGGGCRKPVEKESFCAEVYDVVFNLKTTKCSCSPWETTVVAGGACSKKTTTTSRGCASWRTVCVRKVRGVIWSCDCSCSADLGMSTLLVKPEAWNHEIGVNWGGNQFFWMPSEKLELDSLMTFKTVQRIGAINGKTEVYGTFGDGIRFAGFGTYSDRLGLVSSVSGCAAGCWGAPYDCTTPDEFGVFDQDCPAYSLCDPTVPYAHGFDTTAVYGTFSIKYNAAKSRALARGEFIHNVIPVGYEKLNSVLTAQNAAYESRGAE